MFYFHHETFEVFAVEPRKAKPRTGHEANRFRCKSQTDGKIETHARTVLRGPFTDAAHANEAAGAIRRLTENHAAAVLAAKQIVERCEADRDTALAEALKARGAS